MAEKTILQQNDTGIVLTVNIVENDGVTPVDLSSSSSLKVYLEKPGQVLLTKDATLEDGPNGEISYTTQSGDLDAKGIYGIQISYVVGGYLKHTSKGSFVVDKNLPGVS